MTNQLTIELPEALYQRIKERAANKNRAIEDEVLDVVTQAVPTEEGLPPELQKAVAELSNLNDKALWKVARSRLPAKDDNKIRQLHYKRQATGLSEAETQLLAELMDKYMIAVLMKSKAAAILHQRGYDVSVLAKPLV